MDYFLTFLGFSTADFQRNRCLRVIHGLLSGPKVCQRHREFEYPVLQPRKSSLQLQRTLQLDDLLAETCFPRFASSQSAIERSSKYVGCSRGCRSTQSHNDIFTRDGRAGDTYAWSRATLL